MSIADTIEHIKEHLTATHAALELWFDRPEALLQYRPRDGGWSVGEVLEHVRLTSHYLLILIDKGVGKALRNVQGRDLAAELASHRFGSTKLDEVGMHRSFPWFRPDHMVPTGEANLADVRSTLEQQCQHCLATLAALREGEGLLYKTTMSVNDLGKIDVYEYIYFLSKHAERHLRQMERIESEWRLQP